MSALLKIPHSQGHTKQVLSPSTAPFTLKDPVNGVPLTLNKFPHFAENLLNLLPFI